MNPYEAPATEVDPGAQAAPWADIERERLLPIEQRIKGFGVICLAWVLVLMPLRAQLWKRGLQSFVDPSRPFGVAEALDGIGCWSEWLLLLAAGWNLLRLRPSGRVFLTAVVLLHYSVWGRHLPTFSAIGFCVIGAPMLLRAGYLWTWGPRAILTSHYRNEVIAQTPAVALRLSWRMWLYIAVSTAFFATATWPWP